MSLVIERKPLTWWEKTYLPQVVFGLKVTLRHLFSPTVTLQYPEERPALPERYRGVPTLVKDSKGRVKCVSCQLCEFVCPPKAIRILPGEISADASTASVEKAPQEFEIDMLRCIYCGLCEEVCPEEAIFLQDTFSVTGYTRDEFKFQKEKLLEMGGTLPDKHFKWEKKRQASEEGNLH